MKYFSIGIITRILWFLILITHIPWIRFFITRIPRFFPPVAPQLTNAYFRLSLLLEIPSNLCSITPSICNKMALLTSDGAIRYLSSWFPTSRSSVPRIAFPGFFFFCTIYCTLRWLAEGEEQESTVFRPNKPSGSIRLGNTGQLLSWLVKYMGRVAKLFFILYFWLEKDSKRILETVFGFLPVIIYIISLFILVVYWYSRQRKKN